VLKIKRKCSLNWTMWEIVLLKMYRNYEYYLFSFLSRLIAVTVFWNFFRECQLISLFQTQGSVFKLIIQNLGEPQTVQHVSWRQIIDFAPKSLSKHGKKLCASATFTTEIVKYFGLSEPELRMFWENANSFLFYAMGCSQVAQWPSKRYKACENSLLDSNALCMRNSTLFDIEK